MKAFLIAVLFFAAFTTYVNGQGPSASGGQDDMSGGTSQINIEGIKCLCNLQASVSTDGTAGASASGGGNCGFDRPAPTLSIDCSSILNGKVDGAFFYLLEVERESMWGGGSSWIKFDQRPDLEVTAFNFPKGLSESEDFTIAAGQLGPVKWGREQIWDLEKQDTTRLSLCSNTQTPGSWEYNLVEMSNQIVLDGKGCPVEKDAKTSIVPNPPTALPPAIYQFPEMLPCERLSWNVKMRDPDDTQVFQIWYDFTPQGLCKPPPP